MLFSLTNTIQLAASSGRGRQWLRHTWLHLTNFVKIIVDLHVLVKINFQNHLGGGVGGVGGVPVAR